MSSESSHILLTVILCSLLMGCRSETPVLSEAEIVEVEEYDTIVTFDDLLLSLPVILRVHDESGLYVYDRGLNKILEFNANGEVVREFGRTGRGPGEFERVDNIILSGDHLYVIDSVQFLIHKYLRNGELISSMDYGSQNMISNILTTIATISSVMGGIRPTNIHNQPYVTLAGHVLLPPSERSEAGRTIYELRDWEGEHLSDVGEIPQESRFLPEGQAEYISAVENHEIPAIFNPFAFPVNDHGNPDEYFMIHSAIAVIAKYNADGHKLWEVGIPDTPETDSIAEDYFETMNRQDASTSIGILSNYASGVSSPDGELYLTVGGASMNQPFPLWIHRFNSMGELTHRYQFLTNSDEVNLTSVVDIDFSERRIFVVTEKAEVRAYRF